MSFNIVSIFSICFLIFSSGVSPGVFGGDSGDIILSQWFGGIAHPQGYLLNSLIGWLFTRLPIDATVAYKANLSAAFFQALTVCFVYLIVKRLTANAAIAAAGSLVLAFAPLFWLYAHIAEVFQLTILLVSISYYLLITWYLDNKDIKKIKNNKNLYFAIIVLGLAFFYHYIAALAVAPFGVFILQLKFNFKKLVILSFAFMAGIFQYLLAPLVILQKPLINWAGPLTLENMLRLISRADYNFYGDFSDPGYPFFTKIIQLEWYFNVIRNDFGLIGLALIVLGFVWVFRFDKKIFNLLLLSFLVSGPIFFGLITFQVNSTFVLGILERYLLPSYLFLGIVLALGVFFAGNYSLKKVPKNNIFLLLSKFIFFVIPFAYFLLNYAETDLSRFSIGNAVGRDTLAFVSKPTIVILQGDTVAFNTQYVYYIEKYSPETVLILAGRMKLPTYRYTFRQEYPDLVYPDYFDNDEMLDVTRVMNDLLRLNSENYQVDSILKPDILPDGYEWLRIGLVNRLYKSDEIPSDEEYRALIKLGFQSYFDEKDNLNNQYSHYITDHIRELYSDSFVNAGNEFIKRNLTDDAKNLYQVAMEADTNSHFPLLALGELFENEKKCDEAKGFYERALELDTNKSLSLNALGDLYKNCYDDEAKANTYYEKAKNTVLPTTFKQFELF